MDGLIGGLATATFAGACALLAPSAGNERTPGGEPEPPGAKGGCRCLFSFNGQAHEGEAMTNRKHGARGYLRRTGAMTDGDRKAAAGEVTAPAFRFAARNGIGVRRDGMLSCLDRIGAGQPPVLQMRLEPQIAA